MSFGDFEIQEHQQDGALHLSLRGELDLATAPVLEERLGRVAAEERAVRLDLSKLEFMDSTGIHVLVNALKAARSNGWRLDVDPDFSPQISRLLELCGVARIFTGAHENVG